MGKCRTIQQKGSTRNNTALTRIKRVEAKFAKKKEELLEIKALHRKIAGEFIDLWMEAKRLKRKR